MKHCASQRKLAQGLVPAHSGQLASVAETFPCEPDHVLCVCGFAVLEKSEFKDESQYFRFHADEEMEGTSSKNKQLRNDFKLVENILAKRLLVGAEPKCASAFPDPAADWEPGDLLIMAREVGLNSEHPMWGFLVVAGDTSLAKTTFFRKSLGLLAPFLFLSFFPCPPHVPA